MAECIELLPGANTQVVPEEPEDKPPEGFIDHNVYAYRRVGEIIILKGITLGPGWEQRPLIPGALSCFKQAKGEDGVLKRDDREEILAKAKALKRKNPDLSLNQIAREIDVPVGTLANWLRREEQQTPEPGPAQAANQKPDTGSTEPAKKNIPQTARLHEREISPITNMGNQILVEAWEKVTMIIADPVALSLLKELIRQGVA